VTLHQLSQATVFTYSSRGKWAFPPILWSFPPTDTLISFSVPGCSACAATPAFSGWLVYLWFCKGFHLPPSLALRVPRPLCYVSFNVVIAYYSGFFCWMGSVCPAGYADQAKGCQWEYHMPLSSPCGLGLPKQSGHWLLAVWEPSWFLHLTSGDVMHGLGLRRSQSFASSRWFFM
jgi:hypothetical protein